MSAKIRLVLADDHPLLMDGLEQLFEAEPDMEILATCSDGAKALETVERERPDVLILDLRMPKLDGLEILRRLSRSDLSTRVVVLTASAGKDELVEAIQLGARGIVLKEMASRMLLQAVRKVHAGGRWLEHETTSLAIDRLLERETGRLEAAERLTTRELEMVRALAMGLSNKEIADKLFVSVGTVKVHLHNIFEKAGVESRMELVRMAEKRGWL